MITHFEAANFKSIKVIGTGLRPFMVLVGPNGAGKTNIVRALELFGEVVRRGTTDPVREQGYAQIIRRGERPARGGLYLAVHVPLPRDVISRSLRLDPGSHPDGLEPVTIEASVAMRGSVSSDDVRVTDEQLTLRSAKGLFSVRAKGPKPKIVESSDPNLSYLFARSLMGRVPSFEELKKRQLSFFEEAFTQEEEPEGRVLRLLNWQRLTSPWIRHFRDAVSVTRLRLDSSALRRDSTFEESSISHLIGPAGEGLAAAVARLRGSSEKPNERFVPLLQALQRVYPRIKDVRAARIQPGRLVLLFKEQGIAEELGQSNVSDGVLHALALLVALEGGLGRAGILAIEEPENAIHPWSLRAMVTKAQEHGARQILLTTHSETVVNAVKDTDSLYIVENDLEEGTTIIPAKKREEALDSILRDSGQKLGEVWLDGTVGGVPESGK